MEKVGVRLNKRDDGNYVALVLDGNETVVASKGPMTHTEAETFMRGLYAKTGAGKETAAYHGIEVTP
jgi:hypothetical protein